MKQKQFHWFRGLLKLMLHDALVAGYGYLSCTEAVFAET